MAAASTPTVCVVGSGGREHALAVAMSRNAKVVVCPGNAGMQALGATCVPGPPEALDADLFVIGPEVPLVEGLADRLRGLGRAVFGPGADGARLEGSKAWMKQVLSEAGVPTARYAAFDSPGPAVDLLRSLPGPWVVKTDGLAAGKGVLVTDDLNEAEADVAAKLSGVSFGEAGRRVVIEEALSGPELSVMAVCDGKTAVALPPARDHKRAFDGDLGPNTGGMGAFSPVTDAGDELVEEVMKTAVEPTLEALSSRGIDYRGVLYAGLILTVDGPKVLEFNVRFGDPETQAVLSRLQGNLTGLLAAAAAGRLGDVEAVNFAADTSVCVVMAAPGYPDAPRLGGLISGLGSNLPSGASVFAAGVASSQRDQSSRHRHHGPAGSEAGLGPGPLVTSAGRVLAVTGTGPSIGEARRVAYEAVGSIRWPGAWWRNDIGLGEAEAAGRADSGSAR
ncbi:MAG: phosphoribosylamine--glycine ligase [Acidimicrobiales bacterium]